MNVLMIEDDLELAEILKEYMQNHGINLINFDEPYTGMSALATQNFDVLLLDLTLPNLDGLDVCKRVAKEKNIPIIISSARSDINDKINALQNGADDYLPKPYDPKELLARIHSLLRRYNEKNVKITMKKHDVFTLNVDKQEIYFKNEKIHLTRAEYEIFSLLIMKKGHIFSREVIAIECESINPESSNKSIDVIIGRLRGKIEPDPKNPQYIKSVRGVGYKLEA